MHSSRGVYIGWEKRGTEIRSAADHLLFPEPAKQVQGRPQASRPRASDLHLATGHTGRFSFWWRAIQADHVRAIPREGRAPE